ncbi:hypothetical protein COT97_00020 [Candidatus Falkowbacteria bacterium CG10_big_fil_rev_8_21_14_0_10_39_11]|uniref:Uncharacterized protein n=1 Tax=Candidatus Falkowbacteria bacterium CG10_big_fil_rev_8_21_14_0_10_39_11 TaxID=1974565 RepID=A0A2H0V6C8_9BACT|nr:MAG: hypothetical protein COT97_00020 [Candidatus Falkowbacteria bacterium CG10_big_fil_rev_8_21_14_0_10_39_11]
MSTKKRVRIKSHSVLAVDRRACVCWDDLHVSLWHGDSYEKFWITVHDINWLSGEAQLHRYGMMRDRIDSSINDQVGWTREEAIAWDVKSLLQVKAWLTRIRQGEKFIMQEQDEYLEDRDVIPADLPYLPDIIVNSYDMNRYQAEWAVEWYLREVMQFPYAEYLFTWPPIDNIVCNF